MAGITVARVSITGAVKASTCSAAKTDVLRAKSRVSAFAFPVIDGDLFVEHDIAAFSTCAGLRPLLVCAPGAGAVAFLVGGCDYIETVWGRGYMLREPTQADERLSA